MCTVKIWREYTSQFDVVKIGMQKEGWGIAGDVMSRSAPKQLSLELTAVEKQPSLELTADRRAIIRHQSNYRPSRRKVRPNILRMSFGRWRIQTSKCSILPSSNVLSRVSTFWLMCLQAHLIWQILISGRLKSWSLLRGSWSFGFSSNSVNPLSLMDFSQWWSIYVVVSRLTVLWLIQIPDDSVLLDLSFLV